MDVNEVEVRAEVEAEDDAPATQVFSLMGILDSSHALAAAQRLYASSHSGLRFFSDFRRVVSTEELAALPAQESEEVEEVETPLEAEPSVSEAY